MVAISGVGTKAILVKANEMAKKPDSIAVQTEWPKFLERLTLDKCPTTYLAVTCVLLVARSTHPEDKLNVLEIKRGVNPGSKGYSASSIGKPLAAFAKEHQIDLRATSQQPMNNQPFTYKEVITEDMVTRPTLQSHWKSFFELAKYINALSSASALNFLAFIFANRRKAQFPAKQHAVGHIDWATLELVKERISEFVDSRSDSGKVGQAFAASLLDLLYSPEFVEQGNSQDPDASIPGDVHVRGLAEDIWLWIEVKQQPIATGQVIGFIDKVSENDGERILYLALKNSDYPNDISSKKLAQHSAKKDVRVTVFESPTETIDWFLEYAPGNYSQVVTGILTRMQARLEESGCSAETLSNFEEIATEFSKI
jgi:hypothetical protein